MTGKMCVLEREKPAACGTPGKRSATGSPPPVAAKPDWKVLQIMLPADNRPTVPPVPYYSDDHVTLYHGDCRDITEWLAADVLVTDPPYGIAYNSGSRREALAASIAGDEDTTLRDWVIDQWVGSALVFGTWRIPRPANTHTRLIWDTKGALGMGNLAVPWKPSDQEVYVIGYDFAGRRDSNVLRHAPVQSMARNGRQHPHEKPLSLMTELIAKTTGETVADPFAGSGSTLVAAKVLGRHAIGVEVEERYCEVIAKRLAQDVLDFGGVA